MKSTSPILVCLICLFLSGSVVAQAFHDPGLDQDNHTDTYCSGLIGNSLAFAFASGVSVAVPALSAGFLAASVTFGLAAALVC
jgi:ABC-type Fe3+ transport system permease subunit